MALKEVIILAGGLGTRLKDAIPDLPKCMAPVNGRPFLFYIINQLRSEGIEHFIFSLGYKHELVEQYLKEQFSTLQHQCIIEKVPLGTGGALLAASYKATEDVVLVVNGDTMFEASILQAFHFHQNKNSDCTILLKPMHEFDRYGVVTLNEDDSIESFKEKQFYQEGLINAGMYILNIKSFMNEELPEKFSFENDFLEKYHTQRKIYGLVQDHYFIDIGIPEDYFKAQQDFKKPAFDLKQIDKRWTLFLDRDGVINYEKKDDYIRNPEEFQFYEGVKEAIKIFSDKFGKIIVVSNQRGVGKGLMTEKDLSSIHQKMVTEIKAAQGRVDHIYYCSSTDPKDPDRKPNPGMAFQAAIDYPAIDLSKAIMIGNKPSDMLFGRNAGLYTLFLATTHPEIEFPHPDIDVRYSSLLEFANAL